MGLKVRYSDGSTQDVAYVTDRMKGLDTGYALPSEGHDYDYDDGHYYAGDDGQYYEEDDGHHHHHQHHGSQSSSHHYDDYAPDPRHEADQPTSSHQRRRKPTAGKNLTKEEVERNRQEYLRDPEARERLFAQNAYGDDGYDAADEKKHRSRRNREGVERPEEALVEPPAPRKPKTEKVAAADDGEKKKKKKKKESDRGEREHKSSKHRDRGERDRDHERDRKRDSGHKSRSSDKHKMVATNFGLTPEGKHLREHVRGEERPLPRLQSTYDPNGDAGFPPDIPIPGPGAPPGHYAAPSHAMPMQYNTMPYAPQGQPYQPQGYPY